jgi:hypothetical protein
LANRVQSETPEARDSQVNLVPLDHLARLVALVHRVPPVQLDSLDTPALPDRVARREQLEIRDLSELLGQPVHKEDLAQLVHQGQLVSQEPWVKLDQPAELATRVRLGSREAPGLQGSPDRREQRASRETAASRACLALQDPLDLPVLPEAVDQ